MQLSYSIDQAAGRVGGIADSAIVQDIETFKNPDVEMRFGSVATRGTNTGEVKNPTIAGETTDEKLVKGVVVASHEMESKPNGNVAAPSYIVGSVLPVMRKGRVWVLAEDTITEGTSTVNVRHKANSPNLLLGSLRGASDTSFTAVLPKSKWKTSTTGNGQLAVLEIDL